MIQKNSFGYAKNGKEIFAYTIKDGKLSVTFLTYGASIQKLLVDTENGPVDVVLGYDDIQGYENGTTYFGATVGRCANRIGNGEFTLNGQKIVLEKNDGKNTLHGGFVGFDKKIWDVECTTDNSITFHLFSPDGDQNFPGDIDCHVTYTIADNSVIIDYFATTKTATICNMTNHSHFNLNSEGNGSGNDVLLQINADYFTPIDSGLIPTGEILPVKNTPFDFTEFTAVTERIDADNDQLKKMGGYDLNYCLNNQDFGLAATVKAQNGITMEVYTDQKGLQFYSGNFIVNGDIGKNGHRYFKRCALCLETQAYPDTINKPNFGDVVITKDKPYKTRTIYKFI